MLILRNLIFYSKKLFSTSVGLSNETCIYAIASSANQRCSLAVVRLSGKQSYDILKQLTKASSYEPRRLYLKSIYNPETSEKIDQGLVVWFKEPNSFTGENVCELHVHGGPAILTSILTVLASFKNTKYAEPGEFSKRAFLNGRMDLVEIEGLCDLINAETEMQRRQALTQMEGSLSKLYKDWREKIIKCLAHVEAYIDFSEEENIEDNVLLEVELVVKSLIKSIENHLNDDRKGERLRNGVRVAIIGEPNAGKSSLINALSKRPVSIVSSIAGTTRDVIENSLNIAGYPIIISDTAGLRNTNELIEIEGVKRALDKIETADILILVVDVRKYFKDIIQNGLKGFLNEHLRVTLDLEINQKRISIENNLFETKKVIFSLNKKDLLSEFELDQLEKEIKQSENLKNISISKIECKEDKNELSELLSSLKISLEKFCSNPVGEMPALTQQRHRDNLTKCIQCLQSYLTKTIDLDNQDYALVAEDLRLACKWIGLITGHVTNEQILDVIFKDFCIGK